MLASFLTTVFFSLSVIFAARSARVLGGPAANMGRIAVATVLLAVWAHGFGTGVRGASLPYFVLSGAIGFGLGDLALFAALTRIGPRLSILLTQCLAAPIAAAVEWFWLGTGLRSADALWAAVILVGVAIALAPDHGVPVARKVFWTGVLFGFGSALGQALGAVISRKAYFVADAADFAIDGGSAAYQRILGGAALTLIVFLCVRTAQPADGPTSAERWRKGWPLVLANALAGPSIGVACYQWALKTTASGVVLPIVATSPLVTIVLTRLLDGERPTRRALVGGIVAVAGAIGLNLAQTLAKVP